MEISSRQEGAAVVITVTGRMDAVSSPEFDRAFLTIPARGEKLVVIDFSGLDYISSAGLRSILAAAKNLKASGGEIRLAGLQKQVNDVFKISGFFSLFKISATIPEALKG